MTPQAKEPGATEPLPCPFCGEKASAYPDGDMEGYTYRCWGATSCEMHTFAHATDAEALAAWNRRAIATRAATREPTEAVNEEPAVGVYVLATKYSDGDPGDPWAIGFYAGKFGDRFGVTASDGTYIGARYRRVRKIRKDVGHWLIRVAAPQLEASPPGAVNLWTMLTESAFDLESDRSPPAASGNQPEHSVRCTKEESALWQEFEAMEAAFGECDSLRAKIIAALAPTQAAPAETQAALEPAFAKLRAALIEIKRYCNDLTMDWGQIVSLISATADEALDKHAGATNPTVAKLMAAARDVLAERQRQVEVEGWTPEHDDDHDRCELAGAAACYAVACRDLGYPTGQPVWDWAPEWWKPGSQRRNLVKAGALILAEIERLDRLDKHSSPASVSAEEGE